MLDKILQIISTILIVAGIILMLAPIVGVWILFCCWLVS